MEPTNLKSNTEPHSCKGGVSECSLTFEELSEEEKWYYGIIVSAFIDAKKKPDEKIILERMCLARSKNIH